MSHGWINKNRYQQAAKRQPGFASLGFRARPDGAPTALHHP